VLRVDDRGVGRTKGGDVATATEDDFAEDALAGVAFLKGRKEIDPRKIGLLGHSEGGLSGPLAATKSRDVAFVIMLAGPGLPGEELMYLQGATVLKAEDPKVTAEKLALQKALQQGIFAIVKT